MAPTVFRIGYALDEKKQSTFLQDSLRREAESRGLLFMPIDSARPLVQQGPFDAILHKLHTQAWLSNLDDYVALYPDTVILEPPQKIAVLRDRVQMLQAVEGMGAIEGGISVSVPKQAVVRSKDAIKGLQAGSAFRFPAISKPMQANGTAEAHTIWLVLNAAALEKVPTPYVLQEFVNHGGLMFKVYVVGNFTWSCCRSSLPDVEPGGEVHSEGLKSFSKISNSPLTDEESSKVQMLMPSPDAVQSIAAKLRQKLGLQLFNFDLIRDNADWNHYYVVDINYFPGYAKVPNYETVLCDFFCSLADEASASRAATVNKL